MVEEINVRLAPQGPGRLPVAILAGTQSQGYPKSRPNFINTQNLLGLRPLN